jgi:hypothetical protein
MPQSQSMLQRERGVDVSTVVLRSTSRVQSLLPALAELIYGSTSTLKNSEVTELTVSV